MSRICFRMQTSKLKLDETPPRILTRILVVFMNQGSMKPIHYCLASVSKPTKRLLRVLFL